MGPADSLGSDWKVMFIPNDNDFDPARPTMKDLENAIDISSAVTWDPITFIYDKEEDMAREFKVGDKVKIKNDVEVVDLRSKFGRIESTDNAGQYQYRVRVGTGLYAMKRGELEHASIYDDLSQTSNPKLMDKLIGVDVVNHPSHYTSDPSGVECITITRHRNFNIGNAFKYLWRNGLKDSVGKDKRAKQIEDLKKAVFYINDEIKRLGGTP